MPDTPARPTGRPPMPHVIVVSHPDNSGILQIFGPYPSPDHAQKAITILRTQPLYDLAGGTWDVMPCWPHPTRSQTPTA